MKFRFDLSFCIVSILMLAAGNFKYFCAYVFIFIHELSHVWMAKIFGVGSNEIIFTGFGTNAQLINFSSAKTKFKLLILLAGPVSNLFLAAIIKLFAADDFCIVANFCICIFNLLPIYPLDGGKLFLLALKKRFGLGKTKSFIIIFNRSLIYILFFCGLAQFFFAHDIFLCLMCFYLAALIKKSFYDFILDLYLY